MSVQQTAARGHSKVSARKVADREALFTITLSFSSRGSNSFVGLGFFNMFGGVRVEFADVQPMFVCVCVRVHNFSATSATHMLLFVFSSGSSESHTSPILQYILVRARIFKKTLIQ